MSLLPRFFRHYDLRKVARALSPRALRLALDFIWPRRDARLPLPTTLVIDVCSHCNLRCPLCVRGRDEMGRSGRMMTVDEFRRVLDSAPGLLQVNLFDWGEPLLNKSATQMIRLAAESGISVNLHSNFSLELSDDALRELVLSGLDYLSVSADGFTQPVYEHYRVRGDIALVKRNTERVIALRRELRRERPHVTWQYLVTRHNSHELALARAYCERLGVTFFSKPIDVAATVDYLHGPNYEPPEAWHDATRLERPPPELAFGDRLRCPHLWWRPVVHADLKVAPCCYVSRAESDIGDLRAESLEAIWNGARYRYARSLFSPQQQAPRPEGGVVCERCPVVTRYRARRSYPPVVS
ncbi:MAG: radical SAM protein [Myxococcales bacterium]|nr:radical SAM protein [Myxococcales bacterium]